MNYMYDAHIFILNSCVYPSEENPLCRKSHEDVDVYPDRGERK